MTKITSITIKADSMRQALDHLRHHTYLDVTVNVEIDIREAHKETQTDKQITIDEILSETQKSITKPAKSIKIDDISGNVMQDSKSGKYRPYVIINKVNYYGGTFEDLRHAERRLEDMLHNPERYIHEANERKLKRAANAVIRAEKEAQKRKKEFEQYTKQFSI